MTARPSRDDSGESGVEWDGGPVAAPWDPRRCRPDPAGGWRVKEVNATGSTNTDLVSAAAHGAPDRTVLVADVQTAGRGRLGRSWQAPVGRALTFSVLLRPHAVPPARRGWIGALLSLAVVAGIRRRTGLVAELKWPNDVLIAARKVAGVLAELAGQSLVAGAGINVTLASGDLPGPEATSLRLAGADPAACGREELLAAVLDALGPLLDRWQAAGGDMDRSGLREEYLDHCRTIGTDVTIHLPDGRRLVGRAVDVTAEGAIVIDDGARRHRFAAGDVRHLRPAPPARSVASSAMTDSASREPDPAGPVERLARIREQVARAAAAAGRPTGSVRILLATKTVPAARIIGVLRAGADLIGENRVQEVVAKYDELAGVPHESHFIGHLQRNKVTALLGRVSCLQTLDSADLARRLQHRLDELDANLDVMVQVNVSAEPSKSGVTPSDAEGLVRAIADLPRLHLRGYMTIGLNSPDRAAVRAGYARLRRLRDELAGRGVPGAAAATELSMGMSGDFPDAIAEGATIVRIGSAVFGARPVPAATPAIPEPGTNFPEC